ncbi:MAG: TonB-dependent receptor, partial [Gemmatimonadota bacterium]
MRTTSTLPLLLFALAAPLGAQQVTSDSAAKLEELVVTADRSPTPLGRTVASTTVITGEELRQRGVYFLEDALKQVPGAAVVSTGSFGGVSSLFLRGGESDYVKVLIDGVPVNQAGGGFNFGTLSTDDVERIEVVRGPASVLYGSDAVTGVVQIITRRGAGSLHTQVRSQAGSYGTWRGEVGASGGTDQVAYSANLSRYRTDGTYAFNSGYRSTVGSGALTIRPDSRTDLTLTARTGDNTLHFPTDFTGVAVDSNQRSLQDVTTVGLDMGRRFSESAELRVQLASHSENDGSSNPSDNPGDTLGFYSSSQTRTLRRSVDARGIFQATSRVKLTAGGQAEFEDLREFSTSGSQFAGSISGSSFAASRRTVGFYGQSIIDLGAHSLINLGARVDDNQEFGTHFTYRAGLIYAITGGLRARGSIGSAFKEPSMRENFARGAFEVGDPNLKPEQSRSWEVGLEQSLADHRVTLAANYFDQRFRNLIQYDGNVAPGNANYRNVTRASSHGIEVSADLRPVRSTTITASYTYLKTRVDDAGLPTGPGDVFVNGQSLVRRPSHSARVDAHTRLADRLGLGVGVNYVGKRDDVDFRPFPSVRVALPSYVTLDADAAFDLLREVPGKIGVTGTLRVENLFDRKYDT